MIRIMITEDDPMVLAINRRVLEKQSGVRVVHTCSNGKSALEYLENHTVDLLFLDVYMPGMNGLEVLTEIRRQNLAVDVIMITAANDFASISQAMRLGIIDYLVKPFDIERLIEALGKFRAAHSRMSKTSRQESVCQQEIDRLMNHVQNTAEPVFPAQSLDKGLQAKTLSRVIEYLKQEKEPITSSEIGEKIGLSRITVRKYLNYLENKQLIDSQIDYDTGGRPRQLYFWKN